MRNVEAASTISFFLSMERKRDRHYVCACVRACTRREGSISVTENSSKWVMCTERGVGLRRPFWVGVRDDRMKVGELMEEAVTSAVLCTSERTASDPALTDEYSLASRVWKGRSTA
jgi:hypothetical protein